MRILSRLFVVAFLCGLFSIQAQAVQVTINSTVVNGWQYGGATATLRVYADQDFLTSSGEFIKAGNSQSSVGFYRSFVCNVSGVTLTIPTIANFPTTTDSQDVPGARFTFVFYDYRGVRRDVWMASIKIPHSAGSVLDWSLIRNYNHPPGPQPPPTYPSFDQMNAAINSAFSNIPSVAKATEANYGITKLNVPAANPADPKAVGPNDPLITGAAQVGGNNTFTGINSFISPKISSGIKDANGYTILGFSPTLSGAFTTSTYVSVSNGGPTVSLVATGPPTDINLQLSTKGAGSYILPGLGGAGTKCVHANNAGALSLAADDCGTGGGGSGTVTNTLGALPAGNMVIGNNGSDIKTQTGVSATSTGAIQLAQGTINTAIPAITISSTPAGAGQDFLGIYGNWTDNTSGGSTLTLLNLSVDSSPKITLDKSGNEFIAGYCPTCLKQPGSLMASNHTLDANDMGTMLTAQSGSALTLTINSNNVFAGDGGPVDVQNIGTADLTVHPSGVLIDGSGSDIIVAPGTGMRLFNVQSTWRTQRGGAGWAAGTGITLGGAAKPSIAIAATGVSAASYGDATHVPQLSINAQGQTTSAANVSIAIDATNVVSGAKQGLGTKFVTYVGSAPVNGNAASFDANGSLVDSGLTPGGGGGGGSVTSVALSVPSTEFLVTGSPVVTAGTLAIAKNTINANLVAAGPITGAAAVWGFRSLVKADQVATTPYTDQANTFGDFVNTFRAGADFVLADKNTPSKTAILDLSNISSSTQRTINVPNANSTLAQAVSVVSNQFLTGMTAQGVFSQAQAGFTNLAGSLACSQTPALSGDVTTSAGNCTTTLANIPNDTPMVGDILVTNSSAPGTPASGKIRVYVESGNKILSAKNDAGVVTNTAAPIAFVSHQWLTSFGANGNFGQSQPAASDLSNGVTGTTLVVLQNAPTIINPTIAKLGNLISNGFVTTSGSNGTLGVDTGVYTATTDVRIPATTGARVVYADKYAGADRGAQINAANADLGSPPGTIVDLGGGTYSTQVVLSANRRLILEPGTHTMGNLGTNVCNIVLNNSNEIIGAGWNTILLEPSAGYRVVCSAGFLVTSLIGSYGNSGQSTNLTLRDFVIRGTNTTPEGGVRSVIDLGNAKNVKIDSLFLDSTSALGITAGGISLEPSNQVFVTDGAINSASATLNSSSALFTNDMGGKVFSITAATNASPIAVSVDAKTPHMLFTGDRVLISGAVGNTAANGTFTITVTSANTFTLNSSTGNGTYDINSPAALFTPGDPVSILGAGSAGARLDSVILKVNSTSQVVLGSNASTTVTGASVYTAFHADTWEVSNTTFYRAASQALNCVNCRNQNWHNNQFIATGKFSSQGVTPIDIEPNARYDAAENIVIANNLINSQDSTFAHGNGILVQRGGATNAVGHVTVTGNVITGGGTGYTRNLNTGIYVAAFPNVTVSDNRVSYTGQGGITLDYCGTCTTFQQVGVSFAKVYGNALVSVGGGGNAGLMVINSKDNEIHDNWLRIDPNALASDATIQEVGTSDRNQFRANVTSAAPTTLGSSSKVVSWINNSTSALAFPNGFNAATVSGSMVGINTTTPNFTLEVKQPGAGVGVNLLNTSNQRASLGFGLNASVTSGWILGQDSGLNGTKDLFFYDATAGAYRMKIDTLGNVGIGTTSPQSKVHTDGQVTIDPSNAYNVLNFPLNTAALNIVGNLNDACSDGVNAGVYISFRLNATISPACGGTPIANGNLVQYYGTFDTGNSRSKSGFITQTNFVLQDFAVIANGASNWTITSATNANPVEFTMTSPPAGGDGFVTGYSWTIQGGTGNWAAVNGSFPITVTASNKFTIAVNSASFGALAGTIKICYICAAKTSQNQVAEWEMSTSNPTIDDVYGSTDATHSRQTMFYMWSNAGQANIASNVTDNRSTAFIVMGDERVPVGASYSSTWSKKGIEMGEIYNTGIGFVKRANDQDDPFKIAMIDADAPTANIIKGESGRTIVNGIDISAMTVSGNAFASPGIKITGSGDIGILTSGKGVVIKDSDGAGCHRLTINTAGVIATASVTCP